MYGARNFGSQIPDISISEKHLFYHSRGLGPRASATKFPIRDETFNIAALLHK